MRFAHGDRCRASVGLFPPGRVPSLTTKRSVRASTRPGGGEPMEVAA
jgi:hypothetical protein